MRLVFAGTPEFARIAFDALRAAGHDIPLVLTQPDRPAGRGLKLTPSPVKQAALDAGIAVAQPRSLRLDGRYPDEAAEAQAQLRAIAPDVMVVAAYGLILPQWVLDLPRLGCLNIHASLLPRWRARYPARHRGRRRADRRDHHADGRGPGHGRHAAGTRGADRRRDQCRAVARRAGRGRRRGHRGSAAGAGRRRPAGPQAARGRRDLRRQAGQGRGRAGLRAAGEPAGPPRAGIQSGARRQYPPARPGRAGEDLARRPFPRRRARFPAARARAASTSPPAKARCACWSCRRPAASASRWMCSCGWQPA